MSPRFKKNTIARMGKKIEVSKCSNCLYETEKNMVKEISYYAFGLIPIIPLKKKYVKACEKCGTERFLSREEYKQLIKEIS